MRQPRVSCALCGSRGSVRNKHAVALRKGVVYVCSEDLLAVIASADPGTLVRAGLRKAAQGGGMQFMELVKQGMPR
jgi:hypothetical protein